MEPSQIFLFSFLGCSLALWVGLALLWTVWLPLSRWLASRRLPVPQPVVTGDAETMNFYDAFQDLQVAALDATDATDDPVANASLLEAARAFRERTTEAQQHQIREMAAFRVRLGLGGRPPA